MFKIFCWNVQGCSDSKFINTARQFLRDTRPDIVGIVEPRISGPRAAHVIAMLGFPNSFRVEAVGFAGGLWLCWYNTVDVEVLVTHFQFIHCRVLYKSGNILLEATLVYASPNATKRSQLWPHLSRLATTIHHPWVLFGDFNATLSTSDRKGCAASSKPCKYFRQFIFDCALRDMEFNGPEFTWSRGYAQVRLDRFIYNSHWDESFSESRVDHLLRMRSDHRPILLQIGAPPRSNRPSPFRYMSGWQYHDDFKRMVRDSWIHSLNISTTIAHFSTCASNWNKSVFGYIGSKKRHIMACLRGVQRALCCRQSTYLRRIEDDLLIELEWILDQEEILWRQKSCSNWISLGDRNTTYFHRKATIRKQRNKISSLRVYNDDWCDDERILKSEAVKFYRSLFSVDMHPQGKFPVTGCFPSVPPNLMHSLEIIPSHEEINAVLLDMAPLKAPDALFVSKLH
ncbi:hypothetical protein V6N13_097694 [Hibiscus sabdariffa]